jgi:hypothetical protein
MSSLKESASLAFISAACLTASSAISPLFLIDICKSWMVFDN